MRASVRRLVAVVVAIAIACPPLLATLPTARPLPLTFPDSAAFALLVALAALLEGLAAIVTSSGGRAFISVAAIPYLAMLPLFGPLTTAIGIAVAEATAGLVIRRLPWTKALFNVGMLVVAGSVAGTLYTFLGGPVSTTGITFRLPSVVAFAGSAGAFFATNLLLVTSVVALDTTQTFRKTWRLVTAGVWPGDVAAATLALVLAVLYAKFQLLGVLALLLPLVFLHHTNHVNVKLHQLNRDLLRLIVRTIEAKDPYTSGHSIRVANLCRRIAEEMRLPRKTIETIETAALLHDFGKIDVAYGDIISQTGPLTAKQRDVIRSHPARGAELLASISTLGKSIIEAVKHHHEHFDGSGYPDGLAGEEIPLAARIIMVADTVDAMLSIRPYRPALPVSVVADELKRLNGQQFDPIVAEALIRSGVLTDASREEPDLALAATPSREGYRPRRSGLGAAWRRV